MKALKNNKLLGTIFSILIFASCVNDDVYLKYVTINPNGWSEDSLCVFDVPIADSMANYNIYINVRNKNNYPYQNLWLYINRTAPDSTVTSDTIEFYLADQRGKWLGTGIGSILEMPVLYQQYAKLKQRGTYKFEIIHGMRDSILVGINDIGLQIEEVK